MLSFISRLVVTGGGVAGLWYFQPHNQVPHSLAVKPGLDFLIPIGIVTALALGVALIVSGVIT
jgi:hypothetical protein